MIASSDRDEVRTDDEHLGLGVVDDELDLRRREPPVDVDGDGVQQCCTEEHVEVLDAVLVEEGDAVLGADADAGERLRRPARTFVDLCPGEATFPFDQRDVVRATDAVHSNDACHVGDLCSHRP